MIKFFPVQYYAIRINSGGTRHRCFRTSIRFNFFLIHILSRENRKNGETRSTKR